MKQWQDVFVLAHDNVTGESKAFGVKGIGRGTWFLIRDKAGQFFKVPRSSVFMGCRQAQRAAEKINAGADLSWKPCSTDDATRAGA
jgi:hypothetical protein